MPSACVILHLNCCPAADASLFLKQTEGFYVLAGLCMDCRLLIFITAATSLHMFAIVLASKHRCMSNIIYFCHCIMLTDSIQKIDVASKVKEEVTL